MVIWFNGDLMWFNGDLMWFNGDLMWFNCDSMWLNGDSMWFNGGLMRFNGDLMRINGDSMWFNGDLMRFNGDLMRFNGDLMRFNGDLMEIPFGKHTKKYGTFHVYWVNQLFLWQFSITMLKYQRVWRSQDKQKNKGYNWYIWKTPRTQNYEFHSDCPRRSFGSLASQSCQYGFVLLPTVLCLKGPVKL